jgi:RNA polymerase-binding transcription factor DksA
VKKVVAKKPITKKPAPKKPVAKKPVKKVVAKKPVAKKPAKKVVVKKPVAKKPIVKKVIAKKAVVKKPVAKKVEVKKVVTKATAKPVAKKVEVKVSPKAFSKPVDNKKPEPAAKVEPKKTPSYSKPAPAIYRDNVDEQIAGKTRYSDAELVEFKDLINQKLVVAKEELANLIDQMQNPGMNAGDDSDNSYKTLEDGSSTAEKEYISQLAARQRKFIENLDNALIRIENKTYGICRVTGKLISKERLRAVPHTTLSMEAKVQQYK